MADVDFEVRESGRGGGWGGTVQLIATSAFDGRLRRFSR